MTHVAGSETTYSTRCELWANAVGDDDATVVDMFGAFDIESLHFETRCLIGESGSSRARTNATAVHQALADRYQRLTDPVFTHYLPPRVVVELPPDLARSFPNAGAVNDGLRELLRYRRVLREIERSR